MAGINLEAVMKKMLFAWMIAGLAAWGMAAQNVRWVKGNTHAHTANSDGNETPRRVMRWYQDYGYHFLVITDHDMITETLNLDSDKNDDFILIPGEELTLRLGESRTHVCALNPSRLATAKVGKTVVETLQNEIDAARAVGAVPQINHPNWKWSFGAAEMQALHDVTLFELLNVNRDSNSFSAGSRLGTEELWDRLLSAGKVLYGVASDDTHDYLGDFIPGRAYPGKGWVMVRVAELTPEAVCRALDKGDFYASNGIVLDDLTITAGEYKLSIKPYGDTAYTTFFIGRAGQVLKKEDGLNPVYTFNGDELYVRAKVFSSGGELAFCQPVFIKK
jgi:hypothetical protein